MTTNTSALWLTIRAEDARGLIRFLVEAFGFEEALVVADGDTVAHAELRWPLGGGVMLGSARDDPDDAWPLRPGTAGAYVVTDDPDALFERCRLRRGVRAPQALRHRLRVSRVRRPRSRGQPLVVRHLRGGLVAGLTVGGVGQDVGVSQQQSDAPVDDEVPVDAPVEQAPIPDAARHRWTELVDEISAAQFAYYVRDAPTLSDGQYDALMRELQALEEEHPALRTPDSPTQTVGGDVLHRVRGRSTTSERMLSLDNVFSDEELRAWADRVERDAGGDRRS